MPNQAKPGATPAPSAPQRDYVRQLETELRETRARLLHAETALSAIHSQLTHRMRNLLGVMRSIVSRTVRNSTDIDELGAHLDGRLDTLARTEAALSRSPDEAISLEDMVREEMVALAVREDQVTIEGPEVKLKRDAADTLALALHELSTNAVKFGALSASGGRLSVTWRVIDADTRRKLSLEWRESGVRALALQPARSGFGRELLERGLPYELGATTALEFGRGGLRALIEIPLSGQIAELGDQASEA